MFFLIDVLKPSVPLSMERRKKNHETTAKKKKGNYYRRGGLRLLPGPATGWRETYERTPKQ